MKNILVPCDFSKPATNAFRFALDMAAAGKVKIHLVHVVELPVLHDTVLMPVLNFENELIKELEAKANTSFDKLSSKYNDAGLKLITKVLFGSVLTSLMRYIQDEKIDIVVMGSLGATGIREMLIGSNAEKVVRLSPVPVMVVKEYSKKEIKHIVFPNTLDTENQEELVLKVKALQHFFNAVLHIVWINTPVSFSSDVVTMKRLESFAKRFMLKDYTLNVFNHTDEEQGIVAFAKQVDADLIALGTHGRRGVAHLLNGSLAEDLVNHTQGLVWTYSLKSVTATPNQYA